MFQQSFWKEEKYCESIHQMQAEISKMNEEFRVQGQKQRSISPGNDFAKQDQKMKQLIQKYAEG